MNDTMATNLTELEIKLEQTQTALEKSEQRYYDLFENAGESILIFDANNLHVIEANGNAARRMGYELDELIQLPLNDLEIIPDELAEQPPAWQSQFTQTRFYECLYRRRDGSLVPVEVSSRLVTWDSVTVLQNFVRDISYRKELEAARKRAEAEALRLATVIEQASAVVLITDLEGCIEYANPHFELTTGYSVEEALGQNPRMLRGDVQDESFYADLWTTIKRGDDWHGIFTNRRKDGSLYFEEATIFPF